MKIEKNSVYALSTDNILSNIRSTIFQILFLRNVSLTQMFSHAMQIIVLLPITKE